jgi:putative phage-type endonuclease
VRLSVTEGERKAWLAQRRLGVGGSDAAAAVGLSKFKTPLQLYQEKRGEIEEQDLSGNQFIEFGCRLEPVLSDAYTARTGIKIARVNRILKHPDHPWMLASLDRRAIGAPHGVELKTAGAWAARDTDEWGESGSDIIPLAYAIQVAHYYAVTSFKTFHVAALLGGNDFRIYHIPRNEELIAILIEREAEFWEHVKSGIPPPSITYADACAKFPRHLVGTAIEATPEIVQAEAALRDARRRVRDDKAEIEKIQLILGEFMGENEALTCNGVTLETWKQQLSTRLDIERLEREQPDIYNTYLKVTSSRVMRERKI